MKDTEAQKLLMGLQRGLNDLGVELERGTPKPQTTRSLLAIVIRAVEAIHEDRRLAELRAEADARWETNQQGRTNAKPAGSRSF